MAHPAQSQYHHSEEASHSHANSEYDFQRDIPNLNPDERVPSVSQDVSQEYHPRIGNHQIYQTSSVGQGLPSDLRDDLAIMQEMCHKPAFQFSGDPAVMMNQRLLPQLRDDSAIMQRMIQASFWGR